MYKTYLNVKKIINGDEWKVVKFGITSILLSVSEFLVVYVYSEVFLKITYKGAEKLTNNLNTNDIILFSTILFLNFLINWIINGQITALGYGIISKVTRTILNYNAQQNLDRNKSLEESALLSVALNECARTSHAVLIPIFSGINKTVVASIIIAALAYKEGPLILLLYAYVSVLMLLYRYGTKNKIIALGKKITQANKTRVKLITLSILKQREIKINEKNNELNAIIYKNDISIKAMQAKTNQITQSSKNFIEILLMLTVIIGANIIKFDGINSMALIGFVKTAPIIYQIFSNYLTFSANYNSLEKLNEAIELLVRGRENKKTIIDGCIKGIIEIKRKNHENLIISKTDKILLTGPSGSGKSTFCDAISGNIVLNTHEIKWAKKLKFAIATQHPAFIEGTVKDNFEFFNESKFTDEIAGMVEKLYGSLEILDQKIGTLSGGELQRLSAIRCMFKDADVFIFDEINSALDDQTSSLLMEVLLEKLKDKCCIFVLHKGIKESYGFREIKIQRNSIY